MARETPAPGHERCSYGIRHDELTLGTKRFLNVHRDLMDIERPWSIRVEVCCPAVFPDEASIAWDSELWYAHLRLRCDLPIILREWVLIHELFELKHYRTADAYVELVGWALSGDDLGTHLIKRYQRVRNQEIEQEVGAYLDRRRPVSSIETGQEEYHLVEGEDPSARNAGFLELLHQWRQEDDSLRFEADAENAQEEEQEENMEDFQL